MHTSTRYNSVKKKPLLNNTDSLLVIATKKPSHLQFLIEEMLAETDNLQRGLKCSDVQELNFN